MVFCFGNLQFNLILYMHWFEFYFNVWDLVSLNWSAQLHCTYFQFCEEIPALLDIIFHNKLEEHSNKSFNGLFSNSIIEIGTFFHTQ